MNELTFKGSDSIQAVAWLCGERCHRTGKYSAHMNADIARYLHRYGQQKAMTENGWSADEFRKIFGRNYIGKE